MISCSAIIAPRGRRLSSLSAQRPPFAASVACAAFALAATILPPTTRLAEAVEHKVEASDTAPPKDALPPAIADLLGGPSFRVVRGASRVVCEVWLCKEWTIAADAKPKGDVLYPFQPGQVIGVVRYPRKASDFRDQVVADGVYTLRYGQQPVDGAHVGTSPIRDFLVLIKAADEQSAEPLEYKTLAKKSAAAAGSNHPLLLSLQRTDAAVEGPLSIRHNEQAEWWIVHVVGQSKAGEKPAKQPLDLVVVGHASD
jgi:hypothetical protein